MSNITEAAKISQQINEKSQILNEKLVAASNAAAHSSVDPFIFGIAIFVLACFVGYFVVWKVTPALHTPLMAVTNAISSIVIIGALLQMKTENDIVSILALISVFIATINIVGGFMVTKRMLSMFQRS